MGSQYWALEAHFLFTVNHMLATVIVMSQTEITKNTSTKLLFLKHIEPITLKWIIASLWLVHTAPYGFDSHNTQCQTCWITGLLLLYNELFDHLFPEESSVCFRTTKHNVQSLTCHILYHIYSQKSSPSQTAEGVLVKTTCHPQTIAYIVEETNPWCPLTQKADSLNRGGQSGGD